MKIELNAKFTDVSNDQLAEQRTAAVTELQPLLKLKGASPADVARANELASTVREIDAEVVAREAQAKEFADNAEVDFSEPTVKAEVEEPAAEEGQTAEAADEGDEGDEGEGDEETGDAGDQGAEEGGQGGVEAKTETKTSTVKKIAANSERPQAPAFSRGHLSVVAAADSGFAAGQQLGLSELTQGVIHRLKGMPEPDGDGKSEDLRKFAVATIEKPYDDDLVIRRGVDADEVFHRAANENRLPGGSLVASLTQRFEAAERGELQSMVAANGWCAPSETVYDLTTDETLEGILSLPEVSIRRGGLRFTRGPQFSDFYTNAGFVQTEAQAIAGTTKPCYEVTCPTFTDVRLDAVGLCIKVPILLEVGYPEMVNRFTSGTLIAHEHMKNANVIGRIVTDAGAARVFAGLGSAVSDSLEALALVADQRRQMYRLSFGHSMEVVVPFWLKEVYRSDLGRRTGRDSNAVTDAELMAHFAVRNLAVSFVYDWQVLAEADEVYPATYQVLVYPAGTYVKGTSPVINLSAVYDAASLAVNTYTGMFVEEGLLVVRMKFGADLCTLPICTAGRTGAANLTCA